MAETTRLSVATGTRSTSGDGTAVIAAPGAGLQIILYGMQIQAEADGGVTALLKAGSTTVDRVRCASDGEGKLREYSTHARRFCGANEPVYVNLSDAVAVGYVLEYEVRAA